MTVAASTSLFDYFHEGVHESKRRRGLDISEDTELYLATMLVDRARADRPAPPEETLAELHGRAANSPPAEQARTYRELGDRSLYLLGYFTEHVSGRVTGADYYATMGVAAYQRVDTLFKLVFADAFGPVFDELARRFRECVAVVSDVRDAHRVDRAEDLVVLYERWLRTGDDLLAARLVEGGFVLGPDRHRPS
jgi:hypothetical protein